MGKHQAVLSPGIHEQVLHKAHGNVMKWNINLRALSHPQYFGAMRGQDG